MTTYKPMGKTELQALMQQAAEEQQFIYTRHQRAQGVGLDFQYFNNITEIDTRNLTVTAERDVLLGNLENAVREKGLHLSFYTPDLEKIRLGDFYADQMLALTNTHTSQPRYQVLGLQLMLADGTIVETGGKTMKNVTGYDMNRLLISSRETLAVPVHFTLKLSSMEDTEIMVRIPVMPVRLLRSLIIGMRETGRKPKVCLYYNAVLNRLYDRGKEGSLLVVLSGSKERVERDLSFLSDLVRELHLDMEVIENTIPEWKLLRRLRMDTDWTDGLKIPSLSCEEIMEELENRNIGLWYNIMEGNMQLLPPDMEDGVVYRSLCRKAELLGGSGNRRLQYRFGLMPAQELKLWGKLKQQYDPEGRLNPLAGGGVGGRKE